jgi:hypothetical protein
MPDKQNSSFTIVPDITSEPATVKSRPKRPFWWTPLLAVFILLYIAFNIGVYMYGAKTGVFESKLAQIFRPGPIPSPTAIPSPTPTPRPISHGPKEFTVGQTDTTVPQMRGGRIDPYDPARGATQTVTISIKHTSPVTRVTAELDTDHDESPPIPFTLVSGTALDGTWKGSWQVTDTYLYTYILELKAISGSKTASVVMTLR